MPDRRPPWAYAGWGATMPIRRMTTNTNASSFVRRARYCRQRVPAVHRIICINVYAPSAPSSYPPNPGRRVSNLLARACSLHEPGHLFR